MGIQPSYPPPPPTDVLYVVAAEGLAVHSTPARWLGGIAMIDGSLRIVSQDREPTGRPSFELDGKLGLTSDGQTAYDARAILGTEGRAHAHAQEGGGWHFEIR